MTPEEERERREIQQRLMILNAKKREENRSVGDIADKDSRLKTQRSLVDDWDETDQAVQKQREPAMIEAEMMRDIGNAMHNPSREQALIHTKLEKFSLSPMGEMETIEKDAYSLHNKLLQKYAELYYDDNADQKELFKLYDIITGNADDLAMMEGGNASFERAFMAKDGWRGEHGVQNINSARTGAATTPDYSGEGLKAYARKIKERIMGGE